jgi:hypothetical protein
VISPSALLLKHLVNERDGDGSLAHGGGYAFDVAASHVAREMSRTVRDEDRFRA